MTWMIALLLNHQHVMERVKEEIDRVVGKEKWVEEADIEKLVYLNAIVNETLRMYPSTLGAPHYATKDCVIRGYKVKKDSIVLCNFWKLHRDPKVWEDPEEFKPERFLGKEINEGIDFTYIPFGAGRRICPGKDLAEWVISMTMARLIQGFELSTHSNEPVDMTEGFEASLHKATPLEVVVIPRLSFKMYHGYM
nr:hypothetical protein [Fagopyrum tataricum]